MAKGSYRLMIFQSLKRQPLLFYSDTRERTQLDGLRFRCLRNKWLCPCKKEGSISELVRLLISIVVHYI